MGDVQRESCVMGGMWRECNVMGGMWRECFVTGRMLSVVRWEVCGECIVI